jgi:hypothetical protein
MSDQNDSEKEPCPPSSGTSVPASATRISNFVERARRSEPPEPGSTKLPPRPGQIPDGRDVDPRRILNRDDETAPDRQ